MELAERIRRGDSLELISRWLDGLEPGTRWAEVKALTARHHSELFERASGRATRVDRDFVPSGTPRMRDITHRGTNSLPLFRRFQKHFCLPSASREGSVAWGYSERTLNPLTGPGYFVAREDDPESGPRTVVIDYCAELPMEKPASWPPILSNKSRLSRFIYYGTRDWMWRVSNHVTVGRSQRRSGWMDNWFLLCRE
jgi:hypothetical protein